MSAKSMSWKVSPKTSLLSFKFSSFLSSSTLVSFDGEQPMSITWSTQETRLFFLSLLRTFGLLDFKIGVVKCLLNSIPTGTTLLTIWLLKSQLIWETFSSLLSQFGCRIFLDSSESFFSASISCEGLELWAWTWLTSVSKSSSNCLLVSNDWLTETHFWTILFSVFEFEFVCCPDLTELFAVAACPWNEISFRNWSAFT